ncbi:MAG: DNA polymerase [Planctomycetaceae bacterium]|nr:DNA polymerase [Planctomycetaceae bacterium]
MARIKAWVADRGVALDSLGKDVLAEVLDKDIPDDVRQILTIRQQASKSSTAKLNAFRLRCDSDGRVRGNLMYHGASTGRWSGTGIQIQNFPQGKLSQDDIELGHRLLKLRSPEPIDMIIGNPLDAISSMLRSFIRAEDGKRLLVGDFASIEARVLAWVAEQTDLLAIFESGGDVYKVMASKIYDVEVDEVTKPQRQIGKMAILGLGYGMGWKAFRLACRTMARVEISKKFAKQVVSTYRESNSRIREFWKECNTAAIRAVQTGKPHSVGRLTFEADTDWLKIKLPSGRRLHYRTPKIIEVRAPWSEGFYGEIYLPGDEGNMDRVLDVLERVDADVGEVSPDHIEVEHIPKNVDLAGLIRALGPAANAEFEEKEPEYVPQVRYMSNIMGNRWGWDRTYGGKLTENVVQAIARDFLCESMLRLEDHGYPIIATVHDEVIIELPEGEGTLDEFIELLSTVPRWGSGCPIASEGYEAKRYRK